MQRPSGHSHKCTCLSCDYVWQSDHSFQL